MSRIIRSPQSDLDVFEIALLVANENPTAAERLIDRFDEKLMMLADNPHSGRPRDELAPSLRSYAVGNYLIFYRPIENGIELIRVLHGARDLRRLLRR